MKLFPRRIRRFNPNTFIVKYDSYRPSAFNQGMQAKLKFIDDRQGALKSALSLVEQGHTNVNVIQQRQVVYSHYQLRQMLREEKVPMVFMRRAVETNIGSLYAVAS